MKTTLHTRKEPLQNKHEDSSLAQFHLQVDPREDFRL